MQIDRLARTVLVLMAIGAASSIGVETGSTSASVTYSAMQVTKTGAVTKLDSATSFTIRGSSKSYVVTTNDMTHFTVDSKAGRISQLKKGESVTVKGTLEMSTIKASSVVTGM